MLVADNKFTFKTRCYTWRVSLPNGTIGKLRRVARNSLHIIHLRSSSDISVPLSGETCELNEYKPHVVRSYWNIFGRVFAIAGPNLALLTFFEQLIYIFRQQQCLMALHKLLTQRNQATECFAKPAPDCLLTSACYI
jgi:hypothetical protein